MIDADAASAELLPAEDAPEKKDLGRNGTYLVMRHLRQDVRSFWQFISRASGGNAAEAEKLAAALVGRTQSGRSASADSGSSHSRASERSRIKFARINSRSIKIRRAAAVLSARTCAARIRATPISRAPDRPRSKLITMLGFGPKGFRDDLMSSVRFHRILRRGREYGPELSPADALAPAPPNDPERGLHFICLNANISRQFEFLQNAWIMNTKFSGLTGESDPLLGNREAIPGCPVTSDFTCKRTAGCGGALRDCRSSSRCAAVRIFFCQVCALCAISRGLKIRDAAVTATGLLNVPKTSAQSE